MENKGNMVGVVVSWDPELRAPQRWIDRVYSMSEVSSWLLGVFFAHHKLISYLKEGVKLQFCPYLWTHRASKQRTPLIIKCCSVGRTPRLWLLDICRRHNWSASPEWGYVVKEMVTHHQTCLTHPGLTTGCCSRTFPLWRTTSHITMGSGSSCSPGSGSCFPRMSLRTKSRSLGSRWLLFFVLLHIDSNVRLLSQNTQYFIFFCSKRLKLCFKEMCNWLKCFLSKQFF